jgi:hypothetical protein
LGLAKRALKTETLRERWAKVPGKLKSRATPITSDTRNEYVKVSSGCRIIFGSGFVRLRFSVANFRAKAIEIVSDWVARLVYSWLSWGPEPESRLDSGSGRTFRILRLDDRIFLLVLLDEDLTWRKGFRTSPFFVVLDKKLN